MDIMFGTIKLDDQDEDTDSSAQDSLQRDREISNGHRRNSSLENDT